MSAQNPVDYYVVLGVSANSTVEEIRKSFYKLSLSHHPDRRNKSDFEEAHKEFVLISAAYNVLKDEDSRQEYDSTWVRMTRRYAAGRRGHRENHRFHDSNNREDEFEHRSSQFPRNARFYADQEGRGARRRQNTSSGNQRHSNQREAHSHDSRSTRGKKNCEPYEVPRQKDEEDTSPEDEAWLRFRTAKNNLERLSFSLRNALYMVLEFIRTLRKIDAVRRYAAKARVQLRSIKDYFTNIQTGVGSIQSPMWLREGTVTRVKKMMILEELFRDEVLKSRPPEISGISEQEAIATTKLLLKNLNKCLQLCK